MMPSFSYINAVIGPTRAIWGIVMTCLEDDWECIHLDVSAGRAGGGVAQEEEVHAEAGHDAQRRRARRAGDPAAFCILAHGGHHETSICVPRIYPSTSYKLLRCVDGRIGERGVGLEYSHGTNCLKCTKKLK
jgi:hypothetical protein